jgi:histidinol-phosphate aminotransferase
MVDIKKLVRENVLRLTPYSCARDEFNGSSGIFMDANENPYGKLNRYPDPIRKS